MDGYLDEHNPSVIYYEIHYPADEEPGPALAAAEIATGPEGRALLSAFGHTEQKAAHNLGTALRELGFTGHTSRKVPVA